MQGDTTRGRWDAGGWDGSDWDGRGGWGWFVVGLLLRRSGRGGWGPGGGGRGSAETVLHERYARGEVDVEEYETCLEVLRRARTR